MTPLGRADKEDLAVAGGEVPEEVDAPTAKQPRSSIASHEASPLADPVSHKARKAGNILNSFDSTQVPMSGSAMNSGRGHTMYTLYAQNLMLGRAQDEFSAKRTGRGREICSESEEDASRRRGCVVHS